MPSICRGCSKTFTNSGYLSHLLQTKRPRCVQVREEEEAQGHLPMQERVVDDEEDIEEPPATPVQAFEGDYFGDYAPGDFDDFDNYEGGDSDADLDDEDEDEPDRLSSDGHEDSDPEEDDDLDDMQEAQNYEDEAAWEPPAPSPPPARRVVSLPPENASPPPDDVIPPRAPADDAAQFQANRIRQERASADLRRRTHVVPFPKSTAGAPLPNPRVQTEYEAYRSSVEEANTNPYAPFLSKVDWEFARWAKTRGPGSTAVTELLSIKEVSRHSFDEYGRHSPYAMVIDSGASWLVVPQCRPAQWHHRQSTGVRPSPLHTPGNHHRGGSLRSLLS